MTNFANQFKSKFSQLTEQAVGRFQQGGYVNGDYVKFIKNYKNSDHYKEASEHVKTKIDDFAGSDLNLRVSAVKSIRPALAPVDGGMNAANGFHLDITQELAPGLYPCHITVPAEIIELVDTPDAMGRVTPPDSQVYKANIHGAEEVETKDKDRSNPKKDTKIKGGNRWVDKPGGRVPEKTVFGESKRKNDEDLISEAYASIYSESFAAACRATSLGRHPVKSKSREERGLPNEEEMDVRVSKALKWMKENGKTEIQAARKFGIGFNRMRQVVKDQSDLIG